MQFVVIKPARPIADPAKAKRELLEAMRDTVVDGRAFIAQYPYQKPHIGYRRTHTLGRSWSWRVDVRSDSIEGVVGSSANTAPYNKYVQGDISQRVRWAQRYGWRGVEDLKKVLEQVLEKRLKAAFGGR